LAGFRGIAGFRAPSWSDRLVDHGFGEVAHGPTNPPVFALIEGMELCVRTIPVIHF
jgi:hypothetical protein